MKKIELFYINLFSSVDHTEKLIQITLKMAN